MGFTIQVFSLNELWEIRVSYLASSRYNILKKHDWFLFSLFFVTFLNGLEIKEKKQKKINPL